MVKFFLLTPLIMVFLSSCGIQRAMDRNQYAIQRSTWAINRNIEALDKVTENLKEMQENEEGQ